MNTRTFLKTLAVGAFCLAGCTKPSPETTSETAASKANTNASAKPLKVALLTPGDINDQGWNQLAGEGLAEIKKGGAETAHQVTKTAADQQPALRDFAGGDYDMVICHGFEYGERVKAIASEFPNTKFTVVAGDVVQKPNVATIIPKLEDATYLLGMVAAGVSKTGKVGLIGGMKLPVIASTFQAFEQGARAVNPKVVVLPARYIGNFEDQNAAKEVSNQLIAQGADVLFHNADQAGKGMFNAAQTAKVWCFGSNRNQNEIAPEVCLASAVIEMPRAFTDLARDAQNGKWKPEFRELNMQNKTIAVEWNPKLKAKVPAAAMQKVMAAQKQLESGALKIKRNV
ncbi:MAG TPA: BMP family protein [Abditibacteriaceae bacterium]|jgi:basic membrane lipoprotein Med (substrate-binding protein (PBP1-ABC) superfamily)